MSKWIDAELVSTLIRNDRLLQGNCENELWKQMVDDYVSKLPSIDIVRCKECKHCHYEQNDDIYHCYKLFHRFYNADNHFCSYGERKDHE